jgi:pyrroline-5-carboxylate reductase
MGGNQGETVAKLNKTVGFIGGGNMAEAMIGGLLAAGVCEASRVHAADVSRDRLAYLKKTFGIHTTGDNCAVVDGCDVLVLAVKPQVMGSVLSTLDAGCGLRLSKKLVITIAAGIPVQTIEGMLASAPGLAVVRAMPNTPALVGCGMCGMYANPHVTSADRGHARAILEATGRVIEFETEALLDAVTAVSGSGPAYVFYFVEAMVKAGENLGLDTKDAFAMTLQTVKGAVTLMEERGESPKELRQKVTSPGGTTEAALRVLREKEFPEIVMTAIEAACQRAGELSRQYV